MQSLFTSFLPAFLIMGVWFAPVFLVYKVAYSAKKNTSYVLIGGLLLGWFGAAVVALICPRLSDEEFATMHRPRAKVAREEMDLTKIILCGLGVCLLGLGGLVFFLSRI